MATMQQTGAERCFDDIYVQPHPRAYYAALGALDYEVPEHGVRVFARVLAAMAVLRARRSGPCVLRRAPRRQPDTGRGLRRSRAGDRLRNTYEPVASCLEQFGLVTEHLSDLTYPQRRFADAAEREYALGELSTLGVDPTGKEAEGRYHVSLYVSAPRADAERASVQSRSQTWQPDHMAPSSGSRGDTMLETIPDRHPSRIRAHHALGEDRGRVRQGLAAPLRRRDRVPRAG